MMMMIDIVVSVCVVSRQRMERSWEVECYHLPEDRRREHYRVHDEVVEVVVSPVYLRPAGQEVLLVPEVRLRVQVPHPCCVRSSIQCCVRCCRRRRPS